VQSVSSDEFMPGPQTPKQREFEGRVKEMGTRAAAHLGMSRRRFFQSAAEVCMQKSIREGFGLTVTEALWKGRPTIGGDVGGIPLQIVDGESGFLVSSPEQAAERSLQILRDEELAVKLGRAGKEHARQHFLTPRLLRDWLNIFTDIDV